MVHKSIFQVIESINKWVENQNTEVLQTFFMQELGSLIYEKNQLIDYRNPEVSYKIEFIKNPKSVKITPINEVEENYFKLLITTQYGGVWLYSSSFFKGVLRIDDIILEEKDTLEVGRINTRFYDSIATPYIVEENKKRSRPFITYTTNLLPDLEFDSNPKKNQFIWKYKGIGEQEIKGKNLWYENHFLKINKYESILESMEKESFTRKRKVEE